jgi:tetratricopeptide (TPR) repeat protein
VVTPGSVSSQGPDTTVDLSSCDPEVIEAWEKFQAAAQTQNYSANIPVMEKAVAAFETSLPAAHQASMQAYIHLARNYQQVGMWDKCDKLCARACEKLDTASAGGPVKQTLITLCCAEGMACFRTTKKDRKQHGENCYRRALKVVREMTHPSWRPVELNTIHEFARELLGVRMSKEAVKEMHGAMEMLDDLAEEQLDDDGEVIAPAHPMAMGANGAINRSAILRTMSQAAASMGSMEAAEGGLKEAIKLASAVSADQATMQVECAKRELAYLITTRLPSRVAEAEPLLRNVLEMLQARKAPMTLWLEIATDLGDVLGRQGKYPQVGFVLACRLCSEDRLPCLRV